MITRRHLLSSTAAVGGIAVLGLAGGLLSRSRAEEEGVAETFEIVKTEEAWRSSLTRAEFQVLRMEATEPPGTSPLLFEHRKGVFNCAGCELPVYSSEHKYESGTGWPSFWQPIDEDAVRTKTDHVLGYPRTEVHCRRCGGHFGHVFGDGPQPTGLRHCINGIALHFVPDPKPAA